MHETLQEIKKQKKYDDYFMDIAKLTANMSHAVRTKVGAIAVKDGNIISLGWNGTPFGFDNKCEDEFGNTKDNVIHAEMNMIAKLARTTGHGEGCTVYVTTSPCTFCAKLLVQTKISRVVYLEEYRDAAGIKILKESGLMVDKHIY